MLRPALGLFTALSFAVVGFSTVRFLYAVYGFDAEPAYAALAFFIAIISSVEFAFPRRPE
jgi:hypothetical protein